MKIHDSGYKRLFSNRTIFRQLIETFVEEEWVTRLDFEQAERVDKSFVAEHYKETESDLIYKVPVRGTEQVVILYLLIEFQSTVDRFMALRVLHYITSFCMDYRRGQKKASKLPALFPLVLYNGDELWNAPVNVEDMIEHEPDLGRYTLRFEYFKLAENEYSRETLLALRNIVATLFLAEAHYDIHLLYEPLMQIFEQEEDRQAVQVFMNWFEQLTIHGYRPVRDFLLVEREYRTVEEVKSMLITAIERDREELLARGRTEGIEQGIEQGIERGIERGREQGKEQRDRQIAQAMAQRGMAVAVIADILGICEQDVSRLLADNSAQ